MKTRTALWCLSTLSSGWLLLGAGPAAAEELVSETRDVHDFQAISMSGAGVLAVSRGARESLVIEAPSSTLEKIVTEVEDGVLNIYPKKQSWNLRGPIRMTLTYTELSRLQLSGSAKVTTDWITSERFEVSIQGSSDVEVAGFELEELLVTVSGSGNLDVEELSAETLSVSVSGSGDVSLRGAVAAQTVAVRGSGGVHNVELESETAEVTVSGSGNVNLWVTGLLNATISGSGDIRYRGEPEIQSRVSGSGHLRAR